MKLFNIIEFIKFSFIGLLIIPIVFGFPIITNLVIGLSRTIITIFNPEYLWEQIKLILILALASIVALPQNRTYNKQ